MKPGKNNIFLIGMMGCGKTSIGKALADRLNKTFVDTDAIIESSARKSISEIFEAFGEERFRELESTLFRERAKRENQVFATGGGIVLGQENLQILKESGFTVLLEASPRTLARRVGSPAFRPLLEQAKDVENHLAKIWKEREKAYRSVASLTVNTDEMTTSAVVETIIWKVKEDREDH